MDKDTIKQGIRLLCQVGLGCVFLYAGGLKLFVSGVDKFAVDIANYHLLTPPLIEIVAYFLPWLEVAVGLCLMLHFWRYGALICAIGMTMVFIGGIGWAWSQGLDITCGCFGKSDSKVNYPVKMLLLFLQLAAGIVAISGRVWAWNDFSPMKESAKLGNS